MKHGANYNQCFVVGIRPMEQDTSGELELEVPFKTTRMLNFGDCDISGTAYFPSYLNILNGVNEEFWLHMGFPWHKIIWEERWGTPTVHISSDFSSPSFFGEELEFEVNVVKVGRSSVTLRHEISCKGQKRWSSIQVLAASDLDKHCSIPWPEEMKKALLDRLEEASGKDTTS